MTSEGCAPLQQTALATQLTVVHCEGNRAQANTKNLRAFQEKPKFHASLYNPLIFKCQEIQKFIKHVGQTSHVQEPHLAPRAPVQALL